MQHHSFQRILFVGDAKLIGSLRRTMTARGVAVSAEKSTRNALDQLTRSPFDVVVVDLSSTTDALGFIKRIRSIATFKSTPIIVVGEWGTGEPSLALSAGADVYERAPIDFMKLMESIARLPKRAAAAGKNR